MNTGKMNLNCPHCGERITIDESLTVSELTCPHCQQQCPVPRRKIRLRLEPLGTLPDMAEAGKQQQCPQCKVPMAADAVFCVKCGFDLRTGKIAQTLGAGKRPSQTKSVLSIVCLLIALAALWRVYTNRQRSEFPRQNLSPVISAQSAYPSEPQNKPSSAASVAPVYNEQSVSSEPEKTVRPSTTLASAVEFEEIETVKALLEGGADANAVNENGESVLLRAVWNEYLEVARLLIDHGADVNKPSGEYRNTPVMLAIARGNLPLFELLLQHKVDLKLRNGEGASPLISAASFDQPIFVQKLLALGEDIQTRDNRGVGLLSYAAAVNDPQLIEFLLSKGAKIQDVDSSGNTPLFFAVRCRSGAAVVTLLNHGADPHDAKAITEAQKPGCEQILSMLQPDVLQNKIKAWDKMIGEVFRRNKQAEMVSLLDEGADPTEILQAAIVASAMEPVRISLSRGADPLTADDEGFTSVARAEKAVNAEIVGLLKQALAANNTNVPAPVTNASVKVALTTFTSDDNFYTSAVAVENLTALLQAQLTNEPGVEWIERDQLQAAEHELKLCLAGLASPTAALKVGKWLKADLSVIGRVVTTPRQNRVLQLEIVETDRADVLAKTTVKLRSRLGWPLATADADAGIVAQKVRLLLQQARARLQQAQIQISVAPLFFANTSGNHRLDYLEGEMHSGLTKAATARNGVRILQFPRAQMAAREGGLVLAGLVEQDPIAWQKVADVYVWARYEETKADGVAFEQIPVTFTLNLWDGGDQVQTTTETMKVSELPQLKARIIKRILDTAQSFKKQLPSETARHQVAKQLYFRSSEIAAMFGGNDGPGPLHLTTQGQQLWQYQVNLLATARFFAPESYLIHRIWLDDRWCRLCNPGAFRALPDLPDMLLQQREQISSYGEFSKNYGLIAPKEIEADLLRLDSHGNGRGAGLKPYTVDWSLLSTWDTALSSMGNRGSGKNNPLSVFPIDTPREVRDAWQTQMRGDFADQVFAMCETAVHRTPPIQLNNIPPMYLVEYASALRGKQSRAKFLQDIWPSLLESYYSMPNARREYSAGEYDLYWKRGLFVKLRHFFADAGRPSEAERLIAQFKQKVSIVGDPAAKLKAIETNARTLVALDLLPPRLTPELKHVMFPKTSTVHGVVALITMDGVLWISTRGGILTETGIRHPRDYLVHPHPDSAVWRLSLGASTPESLSPKLGQHSKVTSFCAQAGDLWVTLEQDGVFCITPGTLQVVRYGEKEGVLSRQMFVNAVVSGRLFFGGGEPNRGQLNVVELPRVTWKSQDLGGNNGSPIVLMQQFGHNLLVNERILDTTSGAWRSISEVVLRGYPHHHTQLMQIPQFTLLAATADSSGLWLGSSRGLSYFNPDTGTGQNWFPLPGGYLVDAKSGEGVTSAPTSRLPAAVTALADDGEFLWVGATTRFDPSFNGNGHEGRWTNGYYVLKIEPGIYSGYAGPGGGTPVSGNAYNGNESNFVLLLHKPTGKWVGYFPVTSRVTSLIASGEKLWIGLENTGYVTLGNHDWENKETFAPSPLLEVQKAPLLTISRDKWVSDKVEPAELKIKSQQAVQAVK